MGQCGRRSYRLIAVFAIYVSASMVGFAMRPWLTAWLENAMRGLWDGDHMTDRAGWLFGVLRPGRVELHVNDVQVIVQIDEKLTACDQREQRLRTYGDRLHAPAGFNQPPQHRLLLVGR